MASSSSSSSYLIRFHCGGVFVSDPFSYDYEMLSEIPNVEMDAMNFVSFVKLLVSGRVLVYLTDFLSTSRQHVDNVEQNDASDSDLDDDDYNIYEYDSESEESDTASFVEKDVSADKDVTDKDNIGDKFPIHDPTVKWKLMRPVLGEKYESPDQLKRALAFYALANGYKLYYEVNNPRSFWAKMLMARLVSVKIEGENESFRQYETCLEDHYGKLWSYAAEILNSNPGSTCKMSVDSMPDGLTIISDQHKGIIEAAKQVMPMAEHRQCARHIYANFRQFQ
ncbi:transposase, Ptta/En/Spm [Tanacetum coccineum]